MSIYVPDHFTAADHAAIARLLHDHPFATLITPGESEPGVTHLPLVHIADCDPHGTLLGHFARGNPHWKHAEAAESIAIFHGPHAYVSPSWYAAPAKAVPTWNYVVAHVHGTIRLAQDPAATRSILDTMIHRFESTRDAPWQLGLDQKGLDAMVNAIIGFRLKVKRVEAKFKLSQNRSPDDRARVADALDAEPYADAAATAAWMRAYSGPGRDDPR
jgi:transcriptional regulator